jgi:hypothetical protein
MSGRCMCGAWDCPSCGPAQGYAGWWDEEGLEEEDDDEEVDPEPVLDDGPTAEGDPPTGL